jgi:hypothetical protein
MNERANPFAGLGKPPVFETKPPKEKPVANGAIDRIAEQHNFPSRQARKALATPKRTPRTYRTGRNRHFAVKATSETIERYHKAADEKDVTLARLLELALDALEKQGQSMSS